MTTFSAPIVCNVKSLAENDWVRYENGQETIIPFGTECQIGYYASWWHRLIGRLSTVETAWPEGIQSSAKTIAFKPGDPAYAALWQAKATGRW